MSVASALAVAFKPVASSGDAASNAPGDDAFAGLVAEETNTASAKEAPSKTGPANDSANRAPSDKPARPLNAASALAAQKAAKPPSGDDGAEPAPTLPVESAHDASAPAADGVRIAATLEAGLDTPAAEISEATPVPTTPPPVIVAAPTLILPLTEVAKPAASEPPVPVGATPVAPPQAPVAPIAPGIQAAPTPTPTPTPTDAAAAPEPAQPATQTAAHTAAIDAALDVPAVLTSGAPIRNASAAKSETTTSASTTPLASTGSSLTPDASSTAPAPAPSPTPSASAATSAQPEPSAAAASPVAEPTLAAQATDAADPAASPTLGAPAPPAPSATATSAAFMTGQLSHLSQASLETTVQIAAQISSKLAGRSTRFEMGLTPEGLGRVDVSLDIDANGQLQARLAFDNPLAATELRGRADELRRQLESAGFTIAHDGFEFTDRQPSSSGNGFDRQQGRAFASASRLNADADLSQPAPAAWVSLSLTPRGVDMKV